VASKSPLDSLSSIGGFGRILDTLREVDVGAIRTAAEAPLTLVVASRDAALAEHVVRLLYRGDRAHDIPEPAAALALPLQETAAIALADVVLLLAPSDGDASRERQLLAELERRRIPVLVCLLGGPDDAANAARRAAWSPATVVTLPTIDALLDDDGAAHAIVRAVRARKAVDDVCLARHLPAFRHAVTVALIEDVAFTNAAYSLGAGVLQINPLTGLPLNVADMVILTKNQAILAYKIALGMGMTSDFRTIMPQLAAVVGGGFLFRQLARGLVGLVPGLGIVPKVVIAFAGTYASGEAVRRWCAYGERIDREALRHVYQQALERGRDVARSLGARAGRRLRRTPPPQE
jgi:uncharacterized protein (DUF697 family)